MKKSLRIVLCTAFGLTSLQTFAYNFEKDGIYYNITNGAAEVTYKDTKYASYSGDLVIPATVEYDGTVYQVKSIGKYALRKCFDNLKSVTMPSTITTIGSGAFSECTAITEITIPDEVTTIGTYAFNSCARLATIHWGSKLTSAASGAFMYCWSLTDVELPASLTSIGQNMFQNCYNLKTVKIPASVTTIGQSPFKECSHIVSIEVDEANPNYSSADGILYNKAKTELIQYNGGRGVTSFTVPEGVTTLGYHSFAIDSTLVEVTLPASLTTIYNTAFYNSPALEKVNIGSGVTLVGKQAFQGCTSLKSIDFPDAVAEVQDQAVNGCTSLTAVTFGSGIKTVGSKVFVGSSAIKDVTVKAVEPPTCNANSFDADVYTAAALHVPSASVDAYKAATAWGSFTTTDGSATAIQTVDASNAVPLYYVNILGRMSKQPERGVNLVKMSDGSVKKIIVK